MRMLSRLFSMFSGGSRRRAPAGGTMGRGRRGGGGIGGMLRRFIR